MSMLKVIEVLCESDESWEDAARSAVANAAETIRNVRSIYIEYFEATVEQNKIKSYRINAKITFLVGVKVTMSQTGQLLFGLPLTWIA
jgi:flavin-binding protein dodecin